MKYTEKTFTLPSLRGISDESVKQHLALYAGYVKNFNAISELMPEYASDAKNAIALSELVRRRSFEFGGMRLHEHYFSQWEGGAKALSGGSDLGTAIAAQYGKADYLLQEVRTVGMMRGPGWSLLYWDPVGKQFLVGFSGEQHQGHFVTLPIVLALDVWEHAYLPDYGAAGKGKYVDAFFKNLNWEVMEARFANMQK